jgi:hypothetical protein
MDFEAVPGGRLDKDTGAASAAGSVDGVRNHAIVFDKKEARKPLEYSRHLSPVRYVYHVVRNL